MIAVREATPGMPFFTVIIPAFNSAATLARAIDSVLAQEGEAPEIVVVDDASTDGTAAVLATYAARIRVVRQPTNQGVAAARNLGASVAQGRWLAFLDADDVFYPHRLASHAAWLQDYPELDFLTGDYHYTDEALQITGTSMAASAVGRAVMARADARGRAVLEAPDFEAFVARHFGDTHTLSVPRETFLALGGYPLGFRVCEDVHLLTRLVAGATRIGVICKPLAAYVVHSASVTRRDPVAAQRENVRTLCDLTRVARDFPRGVRCGVSQRLQGARADLAHALLRQGQRVEALSVALQSLVQTPGWLPLRTLLGILRGCA